MPTSYLDSNRKTWSLPDNFAHDDVRMSEDVLERYILEFTEKGDLVFDPFAGFGTTLVVAERLERKALGYEILNERAEYANTLLSKASNVLNKNTAGLKSTELPSIQLCISSPPYMNASDKEDPLRGYEQPIDSYASYISQLASIYINIGSSMADEGYIVIQVQNLRNVKEVTPLTFDLIQAIGSNLTFFKEEVILWEKESYGYSHGYCLVYRP